jgi:cytochrome c oxidase subunit 2
VRQLLASAGFVVLSLVLAPSALAQNGGFTPVDPASPNAEGIFDSFLFVSIFILGIFFLVNGLLVAFIWKYRRGQRGRFEDGVQVHGSTRLELAWTAFPIVILVLIATFVFIELPGITNVPSAGAGGDDLRIRVVGRQFYWQYEYPNGAVSVDTLRAPAGVPVRLEITAPDNDVIHSWWIPAFGPKFDAIPGTVNESWFEVDEPGLYQGQCAELCGVQHAQMLATAEILPQDEFDAWVEQRAAEEAQASLALGEEEWEGVCAKCHGQGGEGGIGPRIAGSPTLTDEEALSRIVRNGVRTMPDVGSGWSNEQVEALVAYLRESPPSGG